MKKFDEVYEKLKSFGEEHLLKFYDELSDAEKDDLLEQIERIDFSFMKTLYEHKDIIPTDDKKIESVQYIKENDVDENDKLRYEKIGESLLKEGKVAVCQLAGRSRYKTSDTMDLKVLLWFK